MLTRQEEEQERRETLENDRLVREAEQRRLLLEGTTMFQHGQSQADEVNQGRFAATGVPHVTGSQPIPKIPQLPSSSPWSGTQPEPGIEPPLGFENSALEPSTSHACVEATSPASADAPSLSDLASLGDAQRAGAGPFSSQTETRLGGPAAVSFASRPDTFIPNVNAGPLSNKDDDNG